MTDRPNQRLRHQRRRKSSRERVLPMQFPPIGDLLQQGGINQAIDNLGANLSALRRQHRHEHRRTVACGYYLAWLMKAEPDLWRDFCHRLEWNDKPNRPRLEDSAKAIEFVFRLPCGLDNPAGQKRASKLKFALLDAWEAGVSPVEIPDWLKERGGIEKAYKARRARLAPANSKPTIAPEALGVAEGTSSQPTLQMLISQERLERINTLDLAEAVCLYVRRSHHDSSMFEIYRVGESSTFLWFEPEAL